MTKHSVIPVWPRLMKAKDAAAYIGTSESNLRRLVEAGQVAKPFIRGGERLWDLRDLDDHADRLSRDGEPIAGDWQGQAL